MYLNIYLTHEYAWLMEGSFFSYVFMDHVAQWLPGTCQGALGTTIL